jgi:hypothetical protein
MSHKYRAKRTTIDGFTFDSMAEARRYELLKMLERSGQITDLVLQPEFVILHPYTRCDGKRIRGIKYKADFSYYDTFEKKRVIEDVKGMETAVFKLKRKLVEYQHDIIITIVKG